MNTELTMTDNQHVEKRPDVRVIPLLAVFMASAFVAILNETLLSVALTPIMEAFHVTASTVQWLTTGYLLVVAVLIPATAFLIQRFTTRQLFLTAMGLFALGTLIAAIAPTFSLLLIGRLTQAIGTGMITPLLTNVILVLIPPARRGVVMGMLGLVLMFAPATGPTLSGLITDFFSWRWLFIFVIPIAILALLYGVFALKNVTKQTYPKIDVLSIVLSTIGFGGIVFAFSSAGEETGGWSNPLVLATLITGTLSLTAFIWRQLRLETPMLNFRALKYPAFTLSLVMIMIVMMTMFATMIVMPMFMLNVIGFSAVTVGLVMLPGGLLNGLASPLTGFLFDKFGPRWLILPGLTIMIIVVFLFRSLDASTTEMTIIILHSLLMVSVAMVMMPAQTNGLNQLPPSLYPHGTAILNTLSQVAGAIGTTLFITIMAIGQRRALSGIDNPSVVEQTAAMTSGIQGSFTFGLILALGALVVAFFIKRVPTTVAAEKNGE